MTLSANGDIVCHVKRREERIGRKEKKGERGKKMRQRIEDGAKGGRKQSASEGR